MTASATDLTLRFTHVAFAGVTHGDTVRFACHALPVLRTTDVAVDGHCGGAPRVEAREAVYIPTDPAVEGIRSRMTCRFIARDTCDGRGEIVVYIEVVDREPPRLENVPPDVVLPTGAPLPAPPPVFAVDACSRNLPVTYRQDTLGVVSVAGVLRHWSAHDEAGNVAADSQRIQWAPASNPARCAPTSLRALPSVVVTPDCADGALLCLGLPEAYTLHVDGVRAVPVGSCDARPAMAYGLAAARASLGSGPIEVMWRVQPGVYRARLPHVDSLLSFLARYAPEAGWTTVGADTLVGDADARFGSIGLVAVGSGTSLTLDASAFRRPPGRSYRVPVGTAVLVASTAACRDSVRVEVRCMPTQERRVTLLSGIRGTHCVQAPAPADTYDWTLVEAAEAAVVDSFAREGGCFAFTGARVGETRVLYERCHRPTGSCERIAITIKVIPAAQQLAPTLVDDYAAVAYNGQAMIDVLLNDQYVGEITSVAVAGSSRGSVRVDSRMRLHYDAPAGWCGEDTFGYIACTAGGCREAAVRVEVTCDKLSVFSGMSPNGDGVNDVFTVLGIENYPENRLAIFNQYGHEVYATRGYANTWLGDAGGMPLTDGTYYYVLEVEGLDVLSGYLQIAR